MTVDDNESTDQPASAPDKPAPAPALAAVPAARGGIARPLFWVTVLTVIGLDLGSKAWAWGFVADGEQYDVFGRYFRIVRAENKGTIWGLGQGYTGVLIVLRCVMVVGLLALAWSTRVTERVKLFGFGLVLGGASGNLCDNLLRENRAVRDFLDFHIPLPWMDGLYHYPTFNIADSSILGGAVLLFIAFSKEGRSDKKAEQRAGKDGEKNADAVGGGS